MYSVSFGSVQSSKVPSLHFLIVNFNPNLKGCCSPYYLDRPGLDAWGMRRGQLAPLGNCCVATRAACCKKGKSRRGTRSISVSGEECVFEGSEVCVVHQTGWHWKSETTHDLVSKILSVNSLSVEESVYPCPNSPVIFSVFLAACIFKSTDQKCSLLCLVFNTNLHEFVSEEGRLHVEEYLEKKTSLHCLSGKTGWHCMFKYVFFHFSTSSSHLLVITSSFIHTPRRIVAGSN